MAPTRLVAVLAALSLSFPGPAAAAIVWVDQVGGQGIVFEAAAGERNDLTVTSVVIDYPNAEVTLRDAGAVVVAGQGCVAAASGDVVCRMQIRTAVYDPRFVRASLADGDDRFSAAGVCVGSEYYPHCLFDVRGGTGDDVIVGGESADDLAGEEGNDSLEGGAGLRLVDFVLSGDHLDGGPGEDRLTGGDGPDLLVGSAGSDVLAGGPGHFPDTVSYASSAVPVRVDLDGAADDGTAGERDLVGFDVEAIEGGRGADRLVGNAHPNELDGGGGNDVLLGGGGADRLVGRAGSDRLHGGRGADSLFANWVTSRGGLSAFERAGRDLLFGEAGNDWLHGQDGTADRLGGGSGRDRAYVDRRLDRVTAVERVSHD